MDYGQFFRDRIKPQGEVVICIPNYNGLIYEIDKSQVEVPIHLYHFKKKDVREYINGCRRPCHGVLEFIRCP